MGIPKTTLHPQELPLDDHSVICLHSLMRLALPVITITRGCGCLINPKQPCVVSIVTYRVTMGRTEIFKFDASTHHLRSCSSIHRTLVLRAIDFSRPFILNEILIVSYTFSLMKMHLKLAAILSRPKCVKHYICNHVKSVNKLFQITCYLLTLPMEASNGN